ncbi:tyrosine 3-monooxygenase-like, partial [Diaphorina citri]|uniref:Tyrosine 3-monooxygenase-like n=1 Tax=Diaphorina citri TaxID=121845 RepID=A0A1S3DN09_DIACI
MTKYEPDLDMNHPGFADQFLLYYYIHFVFHFLLGFARVRSYFHFCFVFACVEIIEVPEPEPEVLPPSDNQSSSSNGNDQGLTEEEVILEKAASESKEAETEDNVFTGMPQYLQQKQQVCILKTIEVFKGTVVHLETRVSKMAGIQFDVLVKVDMTRRDLLNLIRSLRQSSSLGGINLLTENNISVKGPWFPTHASDLDNCNHLMTKYEPDLDMNHPGFSDQVYRQRRKDIAEIAFKYKYGDPIPHIDYTDSEYATWKAVFNTVLDLMPKIILILNLSSQLDTSKAFFNFLPFRRLFTLRSNFEAK